MAWSSTTISADEQTLVAANKPILVGANAMDGVTSAKWTTAANGTDRTHTSYPARYGYDRYLHTGTRSNTTASTIWYYEFVLPGTQSFDCFFFDHIGLHGVEVQLQIADDQAFTSNVATLVTYTASANRRRGFFSLDHLGTGAKRYSAVLYARLRMSLGVNFNSSTLYEVWLGRRRQLRYKPNVPHDQYGFVGSYSDLVSQSGVTTRYQQYSGRREMDVEFDIVNSADVTTIDTFWNEIGNGAKPFLWVENPSSAPHDYSLMLAREGRFEFPQAGPTHRQWRMEMFEQKPFLRSVWGIT